jgi:hypothetical protein
MFRRVSLETSMWQTYSIPILLDSRSRDGHGKADDRMRSHITLALSLVACQPREPRCDVTSPADAPDGRTGSACHLTHDLGCVSTDPAVSCCSLAAFRYDFGQGCLARFLPGQDVACVDQPRAPADAASPTDDARPICIANQNTMRCYERCEADGSVTVIGSTDAVGDSTGFVACMDESLSSLVTHAQICE